MGGPVVSPRSILRTNPADQRIGRVFARLNQNQLMGDSHYDGEPRNVITACSVSARGL